MTFLAVHLVRRHNGPQPLRAFLESYAARPAGVAHELLLALKGFRSDDEAVALLDAAVPAGVRFAQLRVPDEGVDLTAYARVIEHVPADRYCFLNSFSTILVDGWLARLGAALDRVGVGLVGATGSWASQRDYRRYQLGLRSGYDGVFEDRERARQATLELVRTHNPRKRDHGRLPFMAVAALAALRERGRFEPFPAPHVRTNAFAISRDLALALGLPSIRTKDEAYRLESGRLSLTHRVEEAGSLALVVGGDGSVYEPGEWPASETFWQGAQANLLVADNQTRDYAHATATVRRLLSRMAWGERARAAGAGEP